MSFALRKWLVGLLAILCGAAFATPASAACMRGHFQAVEQVAETDWGKPFEVLVADPHTRAFEARGFVLTECRTELQTAAGQAAERDSICAMAYSGNEAVQQQLRKALGVHPALLCRTAEIIAGAWEGRKIDFSEDDLEGIAPPSG